MALNTPNYSGNAYARSQGVYLPHPVDDDAKARRDAPTQALRFRRGWIILPAIVLPLLAALVGFALKRPVVSPLPAPPVEEVARGRILAADGTVLAEGMSAHRFYPQGSLAAPLLGFTGAIQPDGRYGLEGLEYRLDATLQAGADVRLTLDPVLQSAAERHLADSAITHSAERSEERRVGKECRSRWAQYR